jgi:hypothetical protein
MKNIKLAMAIAATLTMASGAVMADTWEVTQTINTGTGDTTHTQTGAATGSVQGTNIIDAGITTTTVVGSQTLTTTAATLTQAAGTATQAINLVRSNGIVGTSSAVPFTQNLTATGLLDMAQTTGANTSLQVANGIVGTGDRYITQDIASVGITMNQEGTGSVQVANYVGPDAN